MDFNFQIHFHISLTHFQISTIPPFHNVKVQPFPPKNILEFQEKLLLCTANNSSNPVFKVMKKNSPISILTGMILHAFNKRGFFVTPARVTFSVRPIPFWVRR
jgi:uncharacterized pyridoxamine 5'-phosphate oxidase family protein